MNIREAARQLEQAARAYGARGPEGAYLVPLAAQRPVYLIGPPGVGKTAVVAQVAARLGLGYAAYTMTHHTRQSALGLPVIAHRTLGGVERAVTEYTMSEIVATVWQRAEAGAERGILFLDEINCVSEALMPAMLQLLQTKTFGPHALPRGWMIVCAGNPASVNRYAHTFDAVTLDRLRVIEVEPDLEAWMAYAVERGTHPAILSYLTLRGEDFYVADGFRAVTARSWSDLSEVMRAMEAVGDAPEEGLVGQYLQVSEVAERFGLYLRLCREAGPDVEAALESGGKLPLSGLSFDRALFALTLLAGRLEARADACAAARREAERLDSFTRGVERGLADAAGRGEAPGATALAGEQIERLERALAARIAAGAADEDETRGQKAWILRLKRLAGEMSGLGAQSALGRLREAAEAADVRARSAEDALLPVLNRALDALGDGDVDPNLALLFLTDIDRHPALSRYAGRRAPERLERLRRRADPEERVKE